EKPPEDPFPHRLIELVERESREDRFPGPNGSDPREIEPRQPSLDSKDPPVPAGLIERPAGDVETEDARLVLRLDGPRGRRRSRAAAEVQDSPGDTKGAVGSPGIGGGTGTVA